MDDQQFIIIGIPTYLRTKSLERLLTGVAALAVPENCRLEILVADNDPQCSARQVVEDFARTSPSPCSYLSEAQRGISHVRNLLLDTATEKKALFLAFIDDDEVPGQNWLIQLLKMQRTCKADLVGGPVTRVFPPSTPAWYSRICFFQTREEPSGPTRKNIDCGNSLLFLPAIIRMGLRFDGTLSLSGGEDLLFSCQARRGGARLAWAADAEVFEHVPKSRLTRDWILRRAFRSGTVTAVIDRKIHPLWLTWGRNMGKALIYFLAGGCKLLYCFLGSPHKLWVPWIFWARGAGFLAGLTGYNYQEYKSPTGD